MKRALALILLLIVPAVAQERIETRQLFRHPMAALAGFENPDGSIEEIEFPTSDYFDQKWPQPSNPEAAWKWAITRVILTDSTGAVVEPQPGDWYEMRPNGDIGVIQEIRKGEEADLEPFAMESFTPEEYEFRAGRLHILKEFEDGSRVEAGELVKSVEARQ